MSFRELRNFSESLRILGYPQNVSTEQFRQPNFPLVSNLLFWLANRIDPELNVPFDPTVDVATEVNRVSFIRNITSVLAAKSRIKLNAKRLYASDGFAVRELLKLTSVLLAPLHGQSSSVGSTFDEGAADASTASIVSAAKVQEVRSLSTSLTTREGAALFDLLSHEIEYRSQRNRCLAKPVDFQEISELIQSRINKAKQAVAQVQETLSQQSSDVDNLKAKIEKRKAELDRTQKRLGSLKVVRPAFMDEFENLESDLAALFSTFSEKRRNAAWLEHSLADLRRRGGDKELVAQWNNLRERMKTEENAILRGEDLDRSGGSGVRVSGSMMNGDDEEEEDEEEEEDRRVGRGREADGDFGEDGESGLFDEDNGSDLSDGPGSDHKPQQHSAQRRRDADAFVPGRARGSLGDEDEDVGLDDEDDEDDEDGRGLGGSIDDDEEEEEDFGEDGDVVSESDDDF